MSNKAISVAMSVYKNDDATFLRVALDSVIGQTLKPKEVVVVGDGPVPETLQECIGKAKEKAALEGIALKWLPQPVNRGLGEALRIACDNCSYDYIARMDSDDISLPDRFEKQMRVFDEHPEVGMVG